MGSQSQRVSEGARRRGVGTSVRSEAVGTRAKQGQGELLFHVLGLAEARKGGLYTCILHAVSNGEQGEGGRRGTESKEILLNCCKVPDSEREGDEEQPCCWQRSKAKGDKETYKNDP